MKGQMLKQENSLNPVNWIYQNYNTSDLLYLIMWKHLIKEAPSKSWESDPIPTNLLKESLPALINIIMDIVKKSSSEANMPEELKEAHYKNHF